MSPISSSTMLCLTLILVLATTKLDVAEGSTAVYDMVKEYSGPTFFDDWAFWDNGAYLGQTLSQREC